MNRSSLPALAAICLSHITSTVFQSQRNILRKKNPNKMCLLCIIVLLHLYFRNFSCCIFYNNCNLSIFYLFSTVAKFTTVEPAIHSVVDKMSTTCRHPHYPSYLPSTFLALSITSSFKLSGASTFTAGPKPITQLKTCCL